MQVADALLHVQSLQKLPALLTQAMSGGVLALCAELAWLLAHITHPPDIVNRLCSPQLMSSLLGLLEHGLHQARREALLSRAACGGGNGVAVSPG